MKRGDWMKLNCGDRVVAANDPRHEGRVECIGNGMARVRWDDGWLSEWPVNALRRVNTWGLID